MQLEQRLAAVQRLLIDAETAYELVVHGDRVSGQAVAALLKRREDLTRETFDIRERIESVESDGVLSDADMIAEAVADLASMPDPLLDQILIGLVQAGRGAAVRRNAPPGLHVVGE